MTESLARLNELPPARAKAELLRCCGSSAWADKMVAARPFAGVNALLETADAIWRRLNYGDWLEAFAAHPRIGSRKDVAATSTATKEWAAGEQAGTNHATKETLDALADANRRYETKFGFIFLVCATGKSAEEMLAQCNERLGNEAATELEVAAEEQRKITRLRLGKLLGENVRTTEQSQ